MSNASAHRSHVRLAVLLLSAATSTTLIGAIVLSFATVSSAPWLPETPEATTTAVSCAMRPTRRDRDTCMEQLVARWQAKERQLASAH